MGPAAGINLTPGGLIGAANLDQGCNALGTAVDSIHDLLALQPSRDQTDAPQAIIARSGVDHIARGGTDAQTIDLAHVDFGQRRDDL